MIIQYASGSWDSERIYMFSLVKMGEIFRFKQSKGYLSQFDRGYNYNVVIE